MLEKGAMLNKPWRLESGSLKGPTGLALRHLVRSAEKEGFESDLKKVRVGKACRYFRATRKRKRLLREGRRHGFEGGPKNTLRETEE